MLNEPDLIPFKASSPTGKKVLALAPHPDDETFGCGGTLTLHVNAGDPVKVVFLTNGAKGDSSGETDQQSYVELRQQEARAACSVLGITDLEFWAYEDRALVGARAVLPRLMDLLESYRPGLVYAPSLLEFHPDHRATTILLWEALRVLDLDFDVAFYEVGQPLSVNRLVDITAVVEKKISASNAYASQLRERAYRDVSLGLNRFRSLTLDQGTTHAEGFSVWASDVIRKSGLYALPFQTIHRLRPEPGEAGPLVSVIVRTKDRPEYLAHALRSIAAQTYPNLEVVLINDGGQDVEDLARSLCDVIPVLYVRHEKSLGRSAAANAGLDQARGTYIIFLDDDDWFEPDHVATLVKTLERNPEAKVAYAGIRGADKNDEEPSDDAVVYNEPYNPLGFLGGNYIPLHAALFHRQLLQAGCRFDETLDVYEDWDFWLQLSQLTTFVHVDQISAVYRASHESGVGLHPDEAKVARGREAIYSKWSKRWGGTEINEFLRQNERVLKAKIREVENLIGFLRSSEVHIEALKQHVQQLENTMQQLENKLQQIEKTLTWRVRRKLLAVMQGLRRQ